MNTPMIQRFVTSVMFLMFFGNSLSAQFAGGDGTQGNPYQITTVDQLQSVKNNLSSHFILINNIDASSTSGWNAGSGFEPIGMTPNFFTGSFDGKGFKITGLTINRPAMDWVGLFSTLVGGQISNTGLEGVTIVGKNRVGALVGNKSGIVTHCFSTGTVKGGEDVGGLIGRNSSALLNSYSHCTVEGTKGVGGLSGSGANIINSYATGNVTGTDEAGGLVGGLSLSASGLSLTNCYAAGNVTATLGYAGGLVGRMQAGTIVVSHATGNVSGVTSVGGLVGFLQTAVIRRSYATGNVTATGNSHNLGGLVGENEGNISNSYASGKISTNVNSGMVGGFVGRNKDRAVTTNSYSSGSVNVPGGSLSAGGFAGSNQQNTGGTLKGIITGAYWNTDSSALSLGVGSDGTSAVQISGLTTIQMRQKNSFAGWDFTEIWNINEGNGFPFLRDSGTTMSASIDTKNFIIPDKFSLSQNFPNPFNPTTNIEFTVPVSGMMSLIVYDALGREVATLVNEQMNGGTYKSLFNAGGLSSGIYYYRLQSGNFVDTKKMMLLK